MFLFTVIQFSCYSGWEKYELDEITTIKNYSWFSDTTNIKFNNSTGEYEKDDTPLDNFSRYLSKTKWQPSLNCGGNTTGNAAQKKDNIYATQQVDAPRNKMDKWNTIFQENRFLKCKSSAEKKKLQVFRICRWKGGDCDYTADFVYDEPLYMGRVEMRLNNGKKRKYLYFQTDYKLKK